MRRLLALLVFIAAAFAATTAQAQEVTPLAPLPKVYVCKYVGKPFVDERLQTGQNPIEVSLNAIPDGIGVGDSFADAQGRSLVIAFVTDDSEDPAPECPQPPPPTTTTLPETTTTEQTTTTTEQTTTTEGGTTSTTEGETTTTAGGSTTTGPTAGQFSFNGVSGVCVEDVPFISITFSDDHPELDGLTGPITFRDIDGNLIETRDLEFTSGATVTLIWPGATVDADGNPTDWPGWKFENGVWVVDESDAIVRDGLALSYTVGGQTATATVAYPPETTACANPPDTVPPTTTPGTPTLPNTPGTPATPTGFTPTSHIPGGNLPFTGIPAAPVALVGVMAVAAGGLLAGQRRRRQHA